MGQKEDEDMMNPRKAPKCHRAHAGNLRIQIVIHCVLLFSAGGHVLSQGGYLGTWSEGALSNSPNSFTQSLSLCLFHINTQRLGIGVECYLVQTTV